MLANSGVKFVKLSSILPLLPMQLCHKCAITFEESLKMCVFANILWIKKWRWTHQYVFHSLNLASSLIYLYSSDFAIRTIWISTEQISPRPHTTEGLSASQKKKRGNVSCVNAKDMSSSRYWYGRKQRKNTHILYTQTHTHTFTVESVGDDTFSSSW